MHRKEVIYLKHPLIWKDYKNGFHIFWIWRFCISFTFEAERSRRFIELWKAKRSLMIVIGKFGIGIGHSFGLI
jgi:hypothetical protein